MAKKCYIGVDNMARKARSLFVGVGRTDLHEILKDLPEGYVQLDYIHSDGSQYINTGFKPNQDTRVVLDLKIESTQGSEFSSILGARVSYNSLAFSVWASDSKFHDDYNDGYIQSDATTLARNTIDKNKNITTVAGVTFTHTYAAFQSYYDLLIGTCNHAGNGYGYGLVGKMYSCQVYDNDTLIRDYVPCKNPSGVVGMYDLVNSKFYQNSGSGSFTAGNILDENSGLAKPVRKAYIGIGGVARPFFAGCIVPTSHGTVSGSFAARRLHSAAVAGYGTYAIWAGGRNAENSMVSTADGVDRNLMQITVPDMAGSGKGDSVAASIGGNAIFRTGNYPSKASVYSKDLVTSEITGLSNYDNSAAASNAKFAIFAGGYISCSDVFAIDKNLVMTTAASLTARSSLAAGSNGREVIFAGGYSGSSTKSYKATVEAYDNNLIKTTLANLSNSRAYLSGARAGTNVIFGGGRKSSDYNYNYTDAYNYNLVKVDISAFSVARAYYAGMTVGECAVFAGGHTSNLTAECYDNKLVKVEIEGISAARKSLAGLSFDDYGLFIAGGPSNSDLTNVVDAYVAL